MIHLLEVTPDLTPAQLIKLARRYAMTGGYEIALAENLESEDLGRLIEIYLPILKAQHNDSMKYKSSNAHRILEQVYNSPKLYPEIKSEIGRYLNSEPEETQA